MNAKSSPVQLVASATPAADAVLCVAALVVTEAKLARVLLVACSVLTQ